jgi:predicted nucleic-acid-binding protein
VIAVDTNVLVRLLVEDDPGQAEAARSVLAEAREAGEECYVSAPVLCEIEWVLSSSYRAGRADVVAAIQELLSAGSFVFDREAAVRAALDAYEAGRADFSDYLIGALARARGARTTYTFDRALQRSTGFTHLR